MTSARSKMRFTLVFASLFLASCAFLGLSPPKTFNEHVAYAQTTVTSARVLATNLLIANKISVEDAENVQKQADIATAGIKLARDIHDINATDGEARLAFVITSLDALSKYLQERETK